MEYRKIEAAEIKNMDEAQLKEVLEKNDTAVEELKQQVKTGEGKLEAANQKIVELEKNEKKENDPSPMDTIKEIFGNERPQDQN